VVLAEQTPAIQQTHGETMELILFLVMHLRPLLLRVEAVVVGIQALLLDQVILQEEMVVQVAEERTGQRLAQVMYQM
jgi:hypothetical protein